MPKAQFQADRYHMTMGNFSLSEHGRLRDRQLAEIEATFYCAYRKLAFAPCVGHERLVENLTHISIDAPRIRFLKNDRAGLSLIAGYLENRKFRGVVRTVKPGTIVFPYEPFADITGPFVLAQLAEVKFEHAFDIPMTVASRALEMRLAAGPDRFLSDFSLRRNGEVERSVDVAKYAYIGGFDDTSNMEAGFLLDQFPVGTMAHYLVESYIGVEEVDSKTSLPKHFEQICFERWLDAHPKGTTLLLDTISVPLGIKHAIAAAKSSSERRAALKAIRLDLSNLGYWASYVRSVLDANGMADVKIIVTGDLDKRLIANVIRQCPNVYAFGVGTKILAEAENVAGVIFKECVIGGRAVLKCSSGPKSTFPGKLQVWRHQDQKGNFIGDLIGNEGDDTSEAPLPQDVSAEPLLHNFWIDERSEHVPSMQEQKEFVADQVGRFRDFDSYPVCLTRGLRKMIAETTSFMQSDLNEYPDLVFPPLPAM